MTKPPKRNISVSSLTKSEKTGWMTKQGGSWKSWKRRWFVFDGDTLYYFKTQKDTEETGYIQITQQSVVKEEGKKKKPMFSIHPSPDAKRTYLMYPDSDEDAKVWVQTLSRAIENKQRGGGKSGGYNDAPVSAAVSPSNYNGASGDGPAGQMVARPAGMGANGYKSNPNGKLSPRDRLFAARESVPFLQSGNPNVSEFWVIWAESIPAADQLTAQSSIRFQLAVSANLEKLQWRTAGTQNIFIQKMVDFFWSVGSPEPEIDKLNDFGTMVNPPQIGSWVDMSARGGMDGGWFFPFDVSLADAMEAADKGDATDKLNDWADRHRITSCFVIGRDMGAAPPRQTEFRVQFPPLSFENQLQIAIDAYTSFDFPPPPTEAMDALRKLAPNEMSLSVVTSSEGFVRLGLLIPRPTREMVTQLCNLFNSSTDGHKAIASLEKSIEMEEEGPAYVEYQHLKENFGYGVYNEGFDLIFHYDLGEESME